MKFFRTFFSILILLIFVLSLALFMLIYMVDPNQLKPVIIKEVKSRTGYDMTMNGKLSWTLYPRLAIKVKDLTVAEPGLHPFVRLQDIKIGMELLDLLHHRDKLPGTIYINRVNFKNVHAEKVSAKLEWRQNGFMIQPLKAELYGGNLKGIISGRTLSKEPQLNFDLKLDHIELKPLLDDLHGENSKLKVAGLAFIQFQGASAGSTKTELLNKLNGDLQFTVNQGVLYGIDLNYFMKTADALINRQKTEDFKASDQTPFNQLSGKVIIKDGIARTNDLWLTSSAFVTKIDGTLVLATQHVDASVNIAPKETDKIAWKIPLLIGDNIKDPTVRLNLGEIQKLILKQEIDKIRVRARNQIKEHVPGKTGEYLQKLLGD